MANLPYFKKVFPNGMRYIFVPQPQSLSTTALVLVSTGSEYERKEISGASHFLEHLCFKGTKKRPSPGVISAELDNLGSDHNAFTGNEITGYYVKVANKNFQKVMEILSDLYLNPLIDENEMNIERGVILEEINVYEDLPMAKVLEDLSILMYGDQPAGRSILGTKGTVNSLTRDDIVSYRDLHYVAPKTTIVVVGGLGVNPEAIIQEYFSGVNLGKAVPKQKTREEQTGPQAFFSNKETDQTHIAIGTRTFNLFDKRKYILTVLADILGGSMSSRLFKKIRNEMGAAYYIKAVSDQASDYGALVITAGVDKTRLPEITEVIMKELNSLRESPVSEKELNKTKEHLSGRMILQIETSDSLAEFYGIEEAITGEILTPDEILKKIKAVTSEELMSLAREIITNDRINLSVIGPISDKIKEETQKAFKIEGV
jgi:predicted Zn-dependent peptidase